MDLTTNINFDYECVFADVQHCSFGTKVIGVIYRPPDTDVNSFTLDFECAIAKVSLSKHEYLIAGDFNIDLLKHESHKGSQSFINTIYSNSLVPLIMRPTRFGDSSSSLIDNIFPNKPDDTSVAGILISDIFDICLFFIFQKLQYCLPSLHTLISKHGH